MPQKFQNFINGKWVDAKSGKTFENRQPDKAVRAIPQIGMS